MVRTLNRHSVTALVAAIMFMLAWFALTMHAQAGCRQFVRQYHRVQQVVAVHHAQPLVVYKAGQDLETDSLVEKIAARVTQKLSAAQTQQQTAPASTVLNQRCASCHNGTKAFSFSGGLSDSQKVRWMEMLAFDKDVPEGMAPVLAKVKADGVAADVTDAVMLSPRLPDGVLQ